MMTVTIVGSFPPTGFLDESGIASASHPAPKETVGTIHSVYDPSTNNWSIIAYYQAGATVLQGDALAHDQSQYGTYRMVQASIGLTLASGGNIGQIPRGFAAANVSNTGYYSYRYIGGYCPTIKFLSNVASNQVCAVAASIAGAMSSYPANSSTAPASLVTTRLACVYSLDVNAATAVNSGIIQAFML
jgi:hypothetical protein